MYYTRPHRHTKVFFPYRRYFPTEDINKRAEARLNMRDKNWKMPEFNAWPHSPGAPDGHPCAQIRDDWGDEQTGLFASTICAGFSPASTFVLKPHIMIFCSKKETEI